jgi:hypothetical protein
MNGDEFIILASTEIDQLAALVAYLAAPEEPEAVETYRHESSSY